MIKELPSRDERVLAFELSGTLHDEDYKTFVPRVDQAIADEGKIRIVADFHQFHGWDAQALWDDTKFAAEHCTKIEKLALVGEEKWEQWMATICKPFTMAEVKYFDTSEIDEAWNWIMAD